MSVARTAIVGQLRITTDCLGLKNLNGLGHSQTIMTNLEKNLKEGAFESRNENKNIVDYFRHPGRATALTDFMNINEAFVEIVRLVKSCKTKLKMFFQGL